MPEGRSREEELTSAIPLDLVCRFKFRGWFAVSGLTILLFAQFSFPGSVERNQGRPPSTERAEESSRFIVAFDLTPDKGFTFTWPLESMRPAPYETVLMVIEKMPRVRGEKKRDRRSEPLLASRHLTVNGRLQKPLRNLRTPDGSKHSDSKEHFLVNLNGGRLRLSLLVPAQLRLDSQHRTASIRLYQVNSWAGSSGVDKLGAQHFQSSSLFFTDSFRTFHQTGL